MEYRITHENDRRAYDDQDRDRKDYYSVFALCGMFIVFHAIILHQRSGDNKETKKMTYYLKKVHEPSAGTKRKVQINVNYCIQPVFQNRYNISVTNPFG